jgi:hypothetical protein
MCIELEGLAVQDQLAKPRHFTLIKIWYLLHLSYLMLLSRKFTSPSIFDWCAFLL